MRSLVSQAGLAALVVDTDAFDERDANLAFD
jgi:hypothetical protein